jgi:ribosomal protein L40E
MTQELVPMKKPCRKCGQSFDTDDVTREQFILYGESVCRECYEEAGISAVSMDY